MAVCTCCFCKSCCKPDGLPSNMYIRVVYEWSCIVDVDDPDAVPTGSGTIFYKIPKVICAEGGVGYGQDVGIPDPENPLLYTPRYTWPTYHLPDNCCNVFFYFSIPPVGLFPNPLVGVECPGTPDGESHLSNLVGNLNSNLQAFSDTEPPTDNLDGGNPGIVCPDFGLLAGLSTPGTGSDIDWCDCYGEDVGYGDAILGGDTYGIASGAPPQPFTIVSVIGAWWCGPLPEDAVVIGYIDALDPMLGRGPNRVTTVHTDEPPAAPCKYVGKELTGLERAERKLSHNRKWTYCLHEDKPLGDAVCTCKGCGPKCPGYKLPEVDPG